MRLGFTLHPKKNKIKTYEKNIFRCPYCEQIITLFKDIDENFTVNCPQCGHIGLISKKIEDTKRKGHQTDKKIKQRPIWYQQPKGRAKVIGLTLIAISLILLFNPTDLSIKISITLSFIGALLFLLISEEKIILPTESTTSSTFLEKYKLVISEKIVLLIIAITLLLFLVTRPENIEIFLVLLYLSLLIIKELIDEFTPVHVKKRLNIFIVVFFIIFIIIIAERIITILDI
jgi:DNA-directed RNA polymerase subunit RPC12/RpoP